MSKLADRFWERMEEMYGAEWTNKHGMEPKQLWIDMLESVDPQAIKHALTECMKSNPRAPTMPEVAAYLKAFDRVLKNQEQFNSLPSKIMTDKEKEEARKVIQKATPGGIIGNRRSILFPDESYTDFQDKLSEAMERGESKEEFTRKRLEANGWTIKDEELYQLQLTGVNSWARLKPYINILEENG